MFICDSFNSMIFFDAWGTKLKVWPNQDLKYEHDHHFMLNEFRNIGYFFLVFSLHDAHFDV
jgi:hypothetical protein